MRLPAVLIELLGLGTGQTAWECFDNREFEVDTVAMPSCCVF